jgi:hypothetical protein
MFIDQMGNKKLLQIGTIIKNYRAEESRLLGCIAVWFL